MNDLSEWDGEKNAEAGLEPDNELLKARLGLSDESTLTSEDADPYLQNQFLRYIQAFEEMDNGPQRALMTIFPESFEFPPPASLNDVQLKGKLKAIREVLEGHGIFLDLAPALPDEQVYEYLIQEVIHQSIPLEFPEGFAFHLEGCDGYCPGCFQREFCDHRIEDWSEDGGSE